MTRPQYNYTSLKEFFAFLQTAVGYLEKADGSDLGDFTSAGKTRNAGYNNYTVYWQWYKELGYGSMQKEPYCACAVSTMMVNAFGLAKTKKLLCGDLYTYCPTGYKQFKNASRAYSTPKAGDVVFFYSSSLGRYSHTGIVIAVDSDGKGYTTWEANTSSGNDVVVRNGGATCKKHYSNVGSRNEKFGRPDYEGNGISISGTGSASTEDPMKNVTIYNIGTGSIGLKCTVSSVLNVRSTPVTGSPIGSIKPNEIVIPSKKCFIDGAPWFYIESKGGWASAKYFTGWIQEKDDNNQWWYLLPNYTYHTDSLESIDGAIYYFGSNGYMFNGTVTFESDSTGALKLVSATSK